MFCKSCGAENLDGATFCTKCGKPLVASGAVVNSSAPVKTWLVESILVTVLCCLPAGIVGIIYAVQAKSAGEAGNVELAQKHAKNAKLATLIGFGIGLVGTIIYICLMALGAIGGAASGR